MKMQIAGTAKLSVKGASGKVAWESSDNLVATVKTGGLVSAKALGTAQITGTYNDETYTCTVTVTDNKLHASVTDLTCSVETKVSVTVEGLTAQDHVNSDIKDKKIVDCEWGDWIGEEGSLNIIPKKIGSTKITITSTNTDESLVINVTVTAKTGPKMKKLNAEQVYAKTSSATVQINTDSGFGSGFFIAPGKVVTNYHVIEGAKSINIQLHNGKTYDVDYILGYSKDLDMAILSVPVDSDVLTINQHGIKVGETVFAIGSPLGLTDTFTNGIVTNAKRVMDNTNYIQTNAAITHGNSGGPLINVYGEVIGINSGGYDEGQNINFAININELYRISTAKPLNIRAFYDACLKDMIKDNTEYYTLEDTLVSGKMDTSQTVTEDDDIIGTIKQGDTDYYKFTLTGNNTLYLEGVSLSFNEDLIKNLNITILDSTGNAVVKSQLDYDDYYELYMQTLEQELSPGTYYISVQADNTTEEIYYFLSLYAYDASYDSYY
jgi:S1-C subfamily serine protease